MDEEIQVELQDLPTPEQEPQTVEPYVQEPVEQVVTEDQEYWRQRALKAEGKIVEQKKATKTQPTTPTPTTNIEPDRLERIELRQDGYSADEVDEIMRLGGRKALENDLIKAGIEAKRKAQRSLDATPTNTAGSPVYKKHTEAELRAMPTSELEKILPHAE